MPFEDNFRGPPGRRATPTLSYFMVASEIGEEGELVVSGRVSSRLRPRIGGGRKCDTEIELFHCHLRGF